MNNGAISRLIVVAVILSCLLAAAAGGRADEPAENGKPAAPRLPQRTATQKTIVSITTEIETSTVAVSAESEKIAWLQHFPKGICMVENGRPGKPYDTIYWPAYAPKGDKFVYFARRAHKSYVVIGGRESSSHAGSSSISDVIFSKDGRNVAIVVREPGKMCVVANRKTHRPYVGITALCFAPRGKKCAYLGLRTGAWRPVLGGKEHAPRKEVDENSFTISPDGKSFGLAEIRDGKCYCIIDDEESGPYDGFCGKSIVFSDKGSRYAFAAVVGKETFVVADGERVEGHAASKAPAFIPGTDTLVYAAAESEGGPYRIVGFEDEGRTYIDVERLYFSEDGKGLAVLEQTSSHMRSFVVEGKPAGEFPVNAAIRLVEYGEGGGHFILTYKESTLTKSRIDGLPLYSAETMGSPTLCPDGKRYIMPVRSSGRWSVVLGVACADGVIEPEKEASYPAEAGGWYKEIYLPYSNRLTWKSATSFHYFALKDREIVFVEEKLGE